MRFLAVLLLAGALAHGADFQQAKIMDVQPLSRPGMAIGEVITNIDMITVTVAIDGMAYSATYNKPRHVDSSNFIVGDSIAAKIDGEKLILRSSSGKELKAKITRRERLHAAAVPDSIESVLKDYDIPNLQQLRLQLDDSKVLYDVIQRKQPLAKLMSIIMTNFGWTDLEKKAMAMEIVQQLIDDKYLDHELVVKAVHPANDPLGIR